MRQQSQRCALVVGGAGFIGSHLVDRLLARGDRVYCVDNLLTGRVENLAQCEDHPDFTFLQADAADFEIPEPVDAVYYLASPASPRAYRRYPLETLAAGSTGVRHSLDVARRHGARFLLTSTSEVYGDPQVHPQREDYHGNVNPVGPRSMYDEAKRFAEALVTAYSATFGLQTRIARIFNTYGPRMDSEDGRVVPTFVRQALAGEPLTVAGKGEQTRSLCYVDDTVAGLLALLDSDESAPVNIGNPHEITVLELARTVLSLCGRKPDDVVFVPLPPEDPQRRCPDITRATSALSWRPTVGLEQGLRLTIAAARNG
jgi:dTDP-glucose 4,6-dehydratase